MGHFTNEVLKTLQNYYKICIVLLYTLAQATGKVIELLKPGGRLGCSSGPESSGNQLYFYKKSCSNNTEMISSLYAEITNAADELMTEG